MRLYIGGQMIGKPGFAASDFNDLAAELRARKHEVFNPAERDESVGLKTDKANGTAAELKAQGFDRRAALAVDTAWITAHSEGMVALPSWPDSPGTKAEIALHQGLYLPVWERDDFLLNGPEGAKPIPAFTVLSNEGIEQEARRLVYGERAKTYGHPRGDFDRVAGMWSAMLGIPIDAEHVALMMIAFKLARLAATPEHRDSQVDVIGYALALDRLLRSV